MEKVSISSIGKSIFTPRKTERKSTNPFAATTFKGNVLTADVFATSKKPAKQNKLTYSAFVGSINNAFPTFRKITESVIAFGNKIGHSISSTIDKINDFGNIEIDIACVGKTLKSRYESIVDNYNVSKLKNYEVSQLESMWKDLSVVTA